MALVEEKSNDKAENSEPRYSLKKRLHAWWEGYELSPLVPDGARAADDAGDAAGAANANVDESGEVVPEWSPARQKLTQLIWGEGFVNPVTPESVVALAQPFGLTAENTMLEIGSGPGGGACAIAEKIGSYVDGFDLSADLAKEALETSMFRGLQKKAVIKAFDPEAFELKPDYYHGCLLRETLIAIEDKEAFLEIVLGAVKPGKPIVITESFASSDEPGPLAAASIAGEPGAVFPCTVDRIIDKLKSTNFEVRVNANETGDYTAMACVAWQGLAERITGVEIDDELGAALMRETKLWDRRNEAYGAGELEMRRIVAFKKSGMS